MKVISNSSSARACVCVYVYLLYLRVQVFKKEDIFLYKDWLFV